MNKLRSWWLAGAGGVALVAVIGAGVVMAQSPTPSPNASGTPSANSGTPKSNEDPTHEAKEDPTREAQEDSGQFSGRHGDKGGRMHGGGPNEDPTHEAGEDPTREAQEDSGNFGHMPKSSATPTTPQQ